MTMRKYLALSVAAGAWCAALALNAVPAFASSHREAPGISTDPAADNTDLYAWVCDQAGVRSLCLVANYNPLQLPEGGPNFNKFSDDVLYQIHITHNDAQGNPDLLDFVTIDVRFKTKPIDVVSVDDPNLGPGGGKEFFAQLAGQTEQTADVIVHRADRAAPEQIFSNAKVAPPNIGQRTSTFVNGDPSYENFAKTFVFDGPRGIKFFAGARDDAFFVNLAQVFDLGAFVGFNELNGQPFRSQLLDVDPNANGQFANTDPTKAPDGVAGLNVDSIALALPLAEIAPDNDPGFLAAVDAGQPSNQTLFGVWASASRQAARVICPPDQVGTVACPTGSAATGPFRQVSRIGLPLINEVVIGIQDKDKFNATTPVDDVNNFGVYFLNPVLVRDVEAVGGFAQLGVAEVPDDLKFGRVDILDVINLNVIPAAGSHNVEIANGRTGDVLRVDVALESAFPNGRPLSGNAVAAGKEEDVTDIELSLILTKLTAPVTDFVGGPGDNRKLLTEFPYIGLPFAGDVESKGSPATF